MTDAEFQRRWNGALTIWQAADAVGMSRSGAASKAYRLRRRKGLDMKKFKPSGRPVKQGHNAQSFTAHNGCTVTVGSGCPEAAARFREVLAKQLEAG